MRWRLKGLFILGKGISSDSVSYLDIRIMVPDVRDSRDDEEHISDRGGNCDTGVMSLNKFFSVSGHHRPLLACLRQATTSIFDHEGVQSTSRFTSER